MASVANSFDVLNDLDDETFPIMSQVVSSADPSPIVEASLKQFENPSDHTAKTIVNVRVFRKNWGDISDEDDDDIVNFPPLACIPLLPISTATSSGQSSNTSVDRSKQPRLETADEKKAYSAFNLLLAKKRVLAITHNIRSFNKETQEVETKIQTREFQIVSKLMYENTKKLVDRMKTHVGDRVLYREQQEKIKLANHLMLWAYKDPSEPCFLYPVVVINLPNGKTLTRDEVQKTSKCIFHVQTMIHYPPME